MTTQQVYYRKWRPSSFGELAGQEHVSTTLRQAALQGRISHSYLFCGPRGCGKTTTARIIAKAANCLNLQEGDPCNACAICQSVNDGRFMDIIELDAASNRGIDEMRDIRDKVIFAPVQGRRKVYIIDEAHMLTPQAANAFLKTLEEPPPHVIFVLCTTEAHQILPTIVSRCQRLDFRRIPSETVYGRLAEIADAEGVAAEPAALRMIARYASGSLRDAENLLEQLVVSGAGSVSGEQVEELLGLGGDETALELVQYLLLGSTAAALSAVNRAAWEGADLRQLHRQSAELMRAFMHLQWGSENAVDLPEHIAAQLRGLVGQIPQGRVVRALKEWGAVNLRFDAPSTLPLELAVADICQAPEPPSAAEPPPERAPAARPDTAAASRQPRPPQPTQPARQRSAPPEPRPPERAPARPPQRETAPASSGPPPETAPPYGGVPEFANAESRPDESPAPDSVPPDDGGVETRWREALRTLNRHKGRKYNLGGLLRDCKTNAVALDGQTLVLPFTNKANLERMEQEMEDPSVRQRIAEAVSGAFGAAYEVRLTLGGGSGPAGGAGPNPTQQSPLVRAAQSMGARVILEEEVEQP